MKTKATTNYVIVSRSSFNGREVLKSGFSFQRKFSTLGSWKWVFLSEVSLSKLGFDSSVPSEWEPSKKLYGDQKSIEFLSSYRLDSCRWTCSTRRRVTRCRCRCRRLARSTPSTQTTDGSGSVPFKSPVARWESSFECHTCVFNLDMYDWSAHWMIAGFYFYQVLLFLVHLVNLPVVSKARWFFFSKTAFCRVCWGEAMSEFLGS